MPSLRKMFLRWVVMVWTLEKRSLAISFVVLPWAGDQGDRSLIFSIKGKGIGS